MSSSTDLYAAGRPAIAPPSAVIDRLVQTFSAVDFHTADASSIEAMLRTAKIDDEALDPFVSFAPGRHTRNAAFRSDAFELIVICWPAHTRSSVHQHGGSRGFVKVLRGTLVAENFAIVANGREPGPAVLEFAGAQIMNAGDIEIVTPGQDVHRVGATAESAVSLHLYARPIEGYLTYDLARQTCAAAFSAYDMEPRRAAS